MIVHTKLSYEELMAKDLHRAERFSTIGVWAAFGILLAFWIVGMVQ